MTLSTLPYLTCLPLVLISCGGNVLLATNDHDGGSGSDQPAGQGGASAGSDTQPGGAGGAGTSAAGGSGVAGSSVVVTDAGSSDAPAQQTETPDAGSSRHFRILVYTRVLEFAHDSIPTGVAMLKGLGAESGDFDVVESQDPAVFTDASLTSYAAVVFLNATGKVITDPAEGSADRAAAFQRYVSGGGGFVGIHHGAGAVELGTAWFEELVGGRMESHDTDQTPGNVIVDKSFGHPSTLGLPATWSRAEEWYYWSVPLGAEFDVLARLDDGRPVSWSRDLAGGGRVFVTVQGHNRTAYAEPLFRQHILGAVRWAAHREDAKPAP